ncbi:MAG: hypothetical protein AMXMBFR84_16400 [Candidatus Hydrogenedentota bacterium]
MGSRILSGEYVVRQCVGKQGRGVPGGRTLTPVGGTVKTNAAEAQPEIGSPRRIEGDILARQIKAISRLRIAF